MLNNRVFNFKFLLVFIFWGLQKSVEAQVLNFTQSWNFGLSPVYSGLSTVYKKSSQSQGIWNNNSIKTKGRSLGFTLHFAKQIKLARHYSFVVETSLLHSRRKSSLEQSFLVTEIIQNRSGVMLLNNLYSQLYVAPKFHFGLFQRNYVFAGPYVEINLLNFSNFKGNNTRYFDLDWVNGEQVLSKLSTPQTSTFQESVPIRNIDYGILLGIGTILALPGKDAVLIELRYSRGAFHVYDSPHMRQNRVHFCFFYSLTNNFNKRDYRK
jgi:hypothetical protein